MTRKMCDCKRGLFWQRQLCVECCLYVLESQRRRQAASNGQRTDWFTESCFIIILAPLLRRCLLTNDPGPVVALDLAFKISTTSLSFGFSISLFLSSSYSFLALMLYAIILHTPVLLLFLFSYSGFLLYFLYFYFL